MNDEKFDEKFDDVRDEKFDDVEEERWMTIKGYEMEKYEVSNFGRVRRWTSKNSHRLKDLDIPRYLKPYVFSNGRIQVCLWKHNQEKHMYIYRLVAIHFVYNPKPNEYTLVDHIDGNLSNNHYTNLRWCSKHLNNLNAKKHKDNVSGRKGVHWDKRRNKWYARIQVNGKTMHIGRFENYDEAVKKRAEAEKQYYNQDFFILDRPE